MGFLSSFLQSLQHLVMTFYSTSDLVSIEFSTSATGIAELGIRDPSILNYFLNIAFMADQNVYAGWKNRLWRVCCNDEKG